MLVTCAAWAEWVWVSDSASGRYNVYIDKTTIQRNGNLRKAWSLIDLTTRKENGSMSIRMMDEHDCKNMRYRTLYISEHSEHMGGGAVLSTRQESFTDPDSWFYIPPDSMKNEVQKIVCAK